MTDYLIEGGRVVLPDGPAETTVAVSDGRIVDLDARPSEAALVIDARGLTVAPALVDIHGDAFERQVMPRPKVFFPTDVAVSDTDRQLAANGIATAYHALTLSWEPGLRAVERGAAFVDAIAAMEPHLAVDHRIQLRWETFAFEAVDLVARVLSGPKTPSLAFNDHTSMSMRAIGVPVTERVFEQSPDFTVASLDGENLRKRTEGNAKRAGLDPDDYVALLGRVWERRSDVDATIRSLAEQASSVGASMLSHDDTTIETRRYYRDLGATIAEFPMCEATARDARAHREPVVLGAPNVVRGGSHIGSLSAADMVEDGVCTVLASDYFYPAMLAAVGRLMAERRAPLNDLWSCVSAGPAAASGLTDRGEIAVGKRADLVLLDWPDGQAPRTMATLSAGRIAHMAGDLIRS